MKTFVLSLALTGVVLLAANLTFAQDMNGTMNSDSNSQINSQTNSTGAAPSPSW